MQDGKPDVWLEALLLLLQRVATPPNGNKRSGNLCGQPYIATAKGYFGGSPAAKSGNKISVFAYLYRDLAIFLDV